MCRVIYYLDGLKVRRHTRWVMRSDEKEFEIEIQRINGTDMEAVAVDVILWLNRNMIPYTIADRAIPFSRGAT